MNRAPQVLVIAKAPGPGRAKTRLVPPLDPDQAALLAEAMLRDTVDGCRREIADVGLLCVSDDDARALRELLGDDLPCTIQPQRGLRAALSDTLREGVQRGPLAIVSSDIPGIPDGSLGRAFAALDGADVVLGPALDGGYWLIAMRNYHDAPFVDIPWSTPACCAVTQKRIRDAGLRVALIDTWLDIDTSVDLSLAIYDPPGRVAARTASVLGEIAAAADVPPPPEFRLHASDEVVPSPWRTFIRDDLQNRAGRLIDYAYFAVPRAVFVVAVTPEDEMLLVRQYRHPVRDWTIEVPAGSVDDGETPQQAAARELAEEAGARGGTWQHLGTFFSSSAHLSLRSDGFLVTDVEVGEANPHDDEGLTLIRRPFSDVIAHAKAGKLTEGQTGYVVLLAAARLGR